VLLDVIADVQRQYAKVQSLSARAEIDEVRGRILSDLLRTTEARLKAGEAARLDVLTVQGESARADSERLARLTESRQAALVLARMIGQPSAEPSWRIDPWQPTGVPDRTEQDWIKLALERRPELQAVIWELGALGQEMKIARLGTLIESSDAGPDFERAEGQWAWGPGASIGIPLFDFGQAKRDLIRARVIEQRHELTRIERSIVEQVRVAIESLKSAQGVLANVEQQLIPIQSERLEQARQSYRHGSADVLAVKLAEQDLQQAKSEQIELQEQVSQAVYGLMRATGGALANHSETPSTRPEITSQSNTLKENHK
jgi:outer membrane protein, heavy metal efflux system